MSMLEMGTVEALGIKDIHSAPPPPEVTNNEQTDKSSDSNSTLNTRLRALATMIPNQLPEHYELLYRTCHGDHGASVSRLATMRIYLRML